MIGKPITGKSFGGCARYIVEKKDAVILMADGVRTDNVKHMIQDFNRQRLMNPELGKAVGHLVLSWSNEDLPKLSPEIMAERALEYMEKMNIRNTQYAIVQHLDGANPHVHIIYNRVDNNGVTISDKNDYQRNVKACKEITLKYGYHLGKGKERVNRQALRGKEKVRYELHDVIKACLKLSKNWAQLEKALQRQGISLIPKYRSGTNEIQGMSFEKGGFKFKGSAIDRSCSYSSLDRQLIANNQKRIIEVGGKDKSLAYELRGVIKNEQQGTQHNHNGNSFLDILFSTNIAADISPMDDALTYKRKRRKRGQSQEISR